jgi:hypothetical protein
MKKLTSDSGRYPNAFSTPVRPAGELAEERPADNVTLRQHREDEFRGWGRKAAEDLIRMLRPDVGKYGTGFPDSISAMPGSFTDPGTEISVQPPSDVSSHEADSS